MSVEKIIIGADHAGFQLKEAIKPYLANLGWTVTDVGAGNPDPVDYPVYGAEVAAKVSSGEFPRGILICGSGVGMTVVANKFPRIRACLLYTSPSPRD